MHTINIKPLSVNKAWQGRRFKTNEYKKYEKDMLNLLPANIDIPEGKFGLYIEAGFSNARSDVDNVAKPFIDILQKKYGFNDSRIYDLRIVKRKAKKGCEYIHFLITKAYEDKMPIIGKEKQRSASKLNSEMFVSARKIMEDSSDNKAGDAWHIGWQDVGLFIDWLEENYSIVKK